MFTWHDKLPFGIDDLGTAWDDQVLADFLYNTALDENISIEHAILIDALSTFDDQTGL